MKQVKGGVTAAKGFEAASTAAGIKYKDRTDMALVYSQVPCVAAGTFTTNVVKAAPVKWDQQVVKSGAKAQAVVVNSGIANACTGAEGFGYCKDTADAAAKALNISADGVLIGSTGVIGKQIPIDKLTAGIEALAGKKNDTLENGTEAAKAIMTTDTFPKELAVTIEVGGKTVTIGGMAKGSGMIHPNMCTMLAFITTDAVITKDALQKALSEDVGDTYNMISVDGDTSTNDSVVLLANGLAENPEITYGTEDYKNFAEALHTINEYLAKKIAGHDANWGRILCAMGYSGAQFDPEKVDLFFESKAGKIQIIENGTAVDYSEAEATKILSEPEVTAIADVKMGDKTATAWGCDLTHGYIEINADYRS